jgi:hypothetical protein
MLDTPEISPMVLSKISRTHPFAMPESLPQKSPVGLKVSSLHAFSRRGKRGYALGQMVATLAAILVIGGLVGVVGFFLKGIIFGKGELGTLPPPVSASAKPTTSTILGNQAQGASESKTSGQVSGSSNPAKKSAVKETEPAAPPPPGPAYRPKNEDVALMFSSLPSDSPQVAEARAVLDSYLAAATPAEKLRYVHRAARCEKLMPEYYEKRGETDPKPGQLTGAGIINGGTLRVLNLSFACDERPTTGLRANFFRSTSGELLLDWEAWTGFSEKAWPDLKKQRPTIPTLVRAVAEESDYYNYEFAESWRWIAVKLRSPDGVNSITGYCDRRSGVGIALANLIGVPLQQVIEADKPHIPIRPPGTKSIVTLRVAYPVNAQSDQCVDITELLADRWSLFDGEL